MDNKMNDFVENILQIRFTPTVTSFHHALNADANLSAVLLCYLGATGAETSLLYTALNSPHPIHAAHS